MERPQPQTTEPDPEADPEHVATLAALLVVFPEAAAWINAGLAWQGEVHMKGRGVSLVAKVIRNFSL